MSRLFLRVSSTMASMIGFLFDLRISLGEKVQNWTRLVSKIHFKSVSVHASKLRNTSAVLSSFNP